MRAEESQFSAGTACEPCQAMGHFCPAHDFNADDDPACRPCLAGNPCSQKQVRRREFDKVAASIAQTSVVKPSPPKADPLRGEKLAETMEQQAAKPGPCSWGCGKPRHRGVCAARRAALISKGSTFAAFTPPAVERELAADVPDTAHVDEQFSDLPAVPSEDLKFAAAVQEFAEGMSGASPMVEVIEPQEALQNGTCVKQKAENFTQAVGHPVFEVVSRSQVQLRPLRNDRYAELAKRLRALGPGDLLKISLPSKTEANCYAKNFSRRLKKYNLRVKYERHGEVLFLEVKQPLSPTSEVSAP